MPINITTSNYINTQTQNLGGGQSVAASVSAGSVEGAVVSAKGLDLQSGQTISGQVVEIDGKDIKLLLSNNQTINARLEGNISALLGQTLSFEVKNTDDGQTALRPLYTNLNNSQNVSNALVSAGLPVTDKYANMVSSMMDENMPINKNAIYEMSKQVNSFPNANPETIVKLNKLGLQVNELTINQFENYKGLEYQIKGNVDTLSDGLSNLIKDSLADTVKNAGIEDISANQLQEGATEAVGTQEAAKYGGKSLLTAFLNAITGQEQVAQSEANANQGNTEALEAEGANLDGQNAIENASDPEMANTVQAQTHEPIDASVFDTTRLVLEMVMPEDSSETVVSKEMKSFVAELAESVDNAFSNVEVQGESQTPKQGRLDILNELAKEAIKSEMPVTDNIKTLVDSIRSAAASDDGVTGENVLSFAKDMLNELENNPQKFPEELKEKLTKLLASKEFGTIVKDNITKQMLLKPEEVVNSKNVEELYAKISKQANQAIEIMQAANKVNPQMVEAANNIKDNVTFMNELNQVVTYVQLPLLMNNKSAHGDLYVYTNKKSLKNNDGNVSALLHLDMDNLGPMDIYVALTNHTKLNTHFYLKDEETIDFIEAHIDALNNRLTKKGYDMNVNVSVKDTSKGRTSIANEFFKDDPLGQGVVASKFSFDVRA